jgi:hypothetical protein
VLLANADLYTELADARHTDRSRGKLSMRSGMPRLTCVDVVIGTHSVVIRNDALVTHRLLETVRRLFGRRAQTGAGRPTSAVE